MPKMKTHKGTQKRVHITATGKVMLRVRNPKRNKRSRSSLYDVKRNVEAHPTVRKTLLKNLPYGDN